MYFSSKIVWINQRNNISTNRQEYETSNFVPQHRTTIEYTAYVLRSHRNHVSSQETSGCLVSFTAVKYLSNTFFKKINWNAHCNTAT